MPRLFVDFWLFFSLLRVILAMTVYYLDYLCKKCYYTNFYGVSATSLPKLFLQKNFNNFYYQPYYLNFFEHRNIIITGLPVHFKSPIIIWAKLYGFRWLLEQFYIIIFGLLTDSLLFGHAYLSQAIWEFRIPRLYHHYEIINIITLAH